MLNLNIITITAISLLLSSVESIPVQAKGKSNACSNQLAPFDACKPASWKAPLTKNPVVTIEDGVGTFAFSTTCKKGTVCPAIAISKDGVTVQYNFEGYGNMKYIDFDAVDWGQYKGQVFKRLPSGPSGKIPCIWNDNSKRDVVNDIIFTPREAYTSWNCGQLKDGTYCSVTQSTVPLGAPLINAQKQVDGAWSCQPRGQIVHN